jgi:hypothetical protein
MHVVTPRDAVPCYPGLLLVRLMASQRNFPGFHLSDGSTVSHTMFLFTFGEIEKAGNNVHIVV